MSQIEHTLTAEQVTDAGLKIKQYLRDNSCDDGLQEYLKQHPLKITFELPSPWRSDIENAPRDGTVILIKTVDGQVWLVYWSTYGWCDGYKGITKFQITAWMEIPALPEKV